MASVYLCEDLKHDRKVALKLLKPELAAVLGAERFVQEKRCRGSSRRYRDLPRPDTGRARGVEGAIVFFTNASTSLRTS